MYASDCFICRKHRGEVSIPGGAIYEDDLVYVGHAQIREGQTTTYLGYLMVEPKRHAPRYPNAPREYWGVHVDEWPEAPHGGPEEMAALCERLRSHLKRAGQ